MRKRLRPLPSAEELRSIYAKPHDHKQWSDHRLRVDITIQLAQWAAHHEAEDLESAADLSCGNGAVLTAVPARRRFYGDFAPGYELCGPLEQTVNQIPRVGLFVNTETLEHVNDPDLVLRLVRAKCSTLVLSTPVGAFNDSNPEHLWAWSRQDVQDMLLVAGFMPMMYTCADFTLSGLDYNFGIWVCQ